MWRLLMFVFLAGTWLFVVATTDFTTGDAALVVSLTCMWRLMQGRRS